MASAGVMQRLDQAPTGITASSPHQRASLKRPRPYHDEGRALPPLRPRASDAAQPTGDDGNPTAVEEEEEESDREDGVEGGDGDSDDDSEYEDVVQSSDEEETVKREEHQRRAPPHPATAAATPAPPTTEQRSVVPRTNGSRGEAPQNPRPQSKQKQKAEGRSPRVSGVSGRGSGTTGKEHKCPECGKVFAKACKLARHAATHTGEKPFLCEEDGCSKAFATKDKLKRHALSHARRRAGLSVSVGAAARREAGVRQRAARFEASAAAAGASLKVEPSPFLLYTAMAETKAPPMVEASRLERERAAHEGGGGGSGTGGGGGWKHSCPTCGRNFLDNYHLKRHIKAIHEGPRPYKCDHPVLVVVAAAAVSPTAADRDGGVSGAKQGPLGGVADKAGGEKAAAAAAEGQEAGSAGCAGLAAGGGVGMPRKVHGICGAAFAKKWQLREHLYSEHGQTKFNSRQHRCAHPGCGRVFDRPSKLAAHEKSHEARFVCQFSGCGAAFVLASGLNLHLKEEHPFRCGVCDKLFDREDKMLIHQGTHGRAGDGDLIRPYACNFPGCGKSFTEKRNLNAHRRTRHTEGGRKRFRCEVGGCSMAFAHRHTLVKHVKREHQGSSSRGPRRDNNGVSESTNPTGNGEHDEDKRQGRGAADVSSEANRRTHDPHAAAAPAGTNVGAVGAPSLEEAGRDAARPVESFAERSAEQSAVQPGESFGTLSPVSVAPPSAEP
eukprot:g10461.t1